jgi:hypothetical protein
MHVMSLYACILCTDYIHKITYPRKYNFSLNYGNWYPQILSFHSIITTKIFLVMALYSQRQSLDFLLFIG